MVLNRKEKQKNIKRFAVFFNRLGDKNKIEKARKIVYEEIGIELSDPQLLMFLLNFYLKCKSKDSD
tara:strand:- start:826 stop:1023 length:198 start_codon:yes stop_codon:yes gene_type:complete